MMSLTTTADWAFRFALLNPTDTAHEDALATLSNRGIPATPAAVAVIETAYRYGTSARRYQDFLLEHAYRLAAAAVEEDTQ